MIAAEARASCGHAVARPSDGDRLPGVVPERTKPGEVWMVGEHTVTVGDSTRQVLPVGDVLVFDPPFDARLVLPDPPAPVTLVFTDNDHLRGVLGEVPSEPRWMVAWDCVSTDMTASETRPLRQMKLCLICGSPHYNWRGDVWDRRIPRPERRTTCQLPEVFRFNIATLPAAKLHQKPVDWVRRLIGCTSAGDDIVDPFLGTGTTLIAAEQLGRRCDGWEISPRLADLAIERIAQWTGHAPERIGVVT